MLDFHQGCEYNIVLRGIKYVPNVKLYGVEINQEIK